ncbi:MAG: chromate resistance protein [Clostridiales bacterium 43-6]|nr:MAG: chromate resistance protein [Clostridiales bacterium 43-6]
MKWVTREKVKVDRVACPWLIKNFIDPNAEFIFVPRDTDPRTIDYGTVYDMKGVELGHHGDECSFDAFIKKYNLSGDPTLAKMQRIVRLADTENNEGNAMAEALEVLATGFSLICKDDHEVLEKEFAVYDAMYAYYTNQQL